MITTAHEVAERGNWSGIIGLDSMQYAKSLYEKFAYKSAFKTAGYAGTVSVTSANRVGFGTDIRQVRQVMLVT